MTAVTVILAAVVGGSMLGLPDSVSETGQAGVSISEASDGVTVQLVSLDNADHVTVHGPESVTYSGGVGTDLSGDGVSNNDMNSVGQSISVSDMAAGDTITVIASLNGKESVIQTYTRKGSTSAASPTASTLVLAEPNSNTVYHVGRTGSDYYTQPFLGNGEQLENVSVWLLEYESEAEVRIGVAPDDGSGYADVENMLFLSDPKNPGTSVEKFTAEIVTNVRLDDGVRYHVVIEGLDSDTELSGSSKVARTSDSALDSMRYSNNAGGTWTIWSQGSIAHEVITVG